MATVTKVFLPGEAILRSTAFPALVQANGSAYPVLGLAFDPSSSETCFWPFVADNYGSGNLTVTLFWYADTASSGDIVFDVAIAAITPNSDTQDIETDSLATANTATDSHLGTTGQRLHSIAVTVSNLDSLAAGDFVMLAVTRDVSDAADTMAGDLILVAAQVTYSDT